MQQCNGTGHLDVPNRSHKVLSLSENVCAYVYIGKNIVCMGFGTICGFSGGPGMYPHR